MDNTIIIPPAPVTIPLTRPQAIAIDRLAHIGRPVDRMAAERLAIAMGTLNWLLTKNLLTSCNSTGGTFVPVPGNKEYFKVTDMGHRSFNKWIGGDKHGKNN
jgi:hypothetical protein